MANIVEWVLVGVIIVILIYLTIFVFNPAFKETTGRSLFNISFKLMCGKWC